MTNTFTEQQPIDPSSLGPADSARMLVELSKAYNAAQPAPALHELSSEVAGQRLAEMEKAFREQTRPRNSAADESIVGAQPPRDGFETVSWPQTTVRNKLDVIDTLRGLEIPDAGIRAIIAGEGKYTEAEVAWARGMKARMETRSPRIHARGQRRSEAIFDRDKSNPAGRLGASAVKYACPFINLHGERRTLFVELDASDLEAARAHPFPGLASEARALQKAYRQAPEGFYHLGDCVTPLFAERRMH
jgi:hypothetical protein